MTRQRFFTSRRSRGPANEAAPDDDRFNAQAEALIPAEVRMISGCHSEQTSADVSNVAGVGARLPDPAGRAGGACTSALLDVLYRAARSPQNAKQNGGKALTFQDLLLKLRESLANTGFDQIPQLTSSRPLELGETPLHLVGGEGTRRALLVGINYRGQSGELSGCQNDVFNMKKYLMEVQGFPDSNITVLVDDGRHPYPTRQRIISSLKALVANSMSGDSVYFHYSGHGGLLMPDMNFLKLKGKSYDETLYPLDHESAGQIRDFSLFNHFVKPMRSGVTVTCVMDCCHSGSVLDLPYSFRPTSAGTIRMRQSMDHLSNLAFLYVLAGGVLPGGGLFNNVTNHIDGAIDGNLEDYQGAGIESAQDDFIDSDYPDFGEVGDAEVPDMDGGVVVPGETVPDADGLGFSEGQMNGLAPPVVDGVVISGEAVPAADGLGFPEGQMEGMAAPPVVVDGVVLPSETVPDAQAQGFGGYEEDAGMGFGDVYRDAGYGDGDEAGMDCGCFADSLSEWLGSLLDFEL